MSVSYRNSGTVCRSHTMYLHKWSIIQVISKMLESQICRLTFDLWHYTVLWNNFLNLIILSLRRPFVALWPKKFYIYVRFIPPPPPKTVSDETTFNDIEAMTSYKVHKFKGQGHAPYRELILTFLKGFSVF